MGLRSWFRDARTHVGASSTRMAVVGGALVGGLALGIPTEQAAFQYTWRDPQFCGDCHAHDYANEAYDRSVHAGVTTCHDCHRVPVRHYPRNLWVMLTHPPQSQADITRPDVKSVICAQCHSHTHDNEPLTGPMPEDIRARVVKVDDSPLHKLHLEAKTRTPGRGAGGEQPGEGGPTPELTADSAAIKATMEGAAHVGPDEEAAEGVITCMDCHGSTTNRAHQFEATTDNCLACHKEISRGTHAMASLDCADCHFDGFVGTRPTVDQ